MAGFDSKCLETTPKFIPTKLEDTHKNRKYGTQLGPKSHPCPHPLLYRFRSMYLVQMCEGIYEPNFSPL
uniref:Uncharacterized protein n=1 Tax=Rhizophora mucronata TaxID=61149 RepID=A0A2P2PAG6_RHIMU